MPLSAQAEPPAGAPPCNPRHDLIRLSTSLKHVAHKLATGEPITIVALGSSSTAGAGASSSLNSYPSQLALELQRHFPGHRISVLNRGVNGEEVPDMLKRFDEAVIANKPDLLLWQMGTNSLIRDHTLNDRGASIREGVDKARAIGSDVVLIDPQFAPKVIAKPQVGKMVEFIAATAKMEDVGLFRALLLHVGMLVLGEGRADRALGIRRLTPAHSGFPQTLSSAARRSSITSSACSSPQDNRTSPSPMPSSAR